MANSSAIRHSTSALFSNLSHPVPSNSSGNSLFNSTGFLPWDRFNAWVHCICIVNFDTEIGQSIEARNFICDLGIILQTGHKLLPVNPVILI